MSHDPKAVKDLFRAAKHGDAATVATLLDGDPSLLSVVDAEQQTPLHCAAWKGQATVVALLLERGADVHAQSTNDHYGGTPLHGAAHGNNAKVVRQLLDAGADPDAVSANGRKPLDETEFHKAAAAAKALREAGAEG